MRFVVYLVFTLLAAVLAQSDPAAEFALRNSFKNYMTKFNKQYATADEMNTRFANYRASLARHQVMNAKNPQAHYGETRHSDMSVEEFKATMLMKPRKAIDATLTCLATGVDASKERFENVAIPTSFDWRNYGKVSPVKDQGQCGSCWTFSTTGAMESAYAVKVNKNITSAMLLSEQAIVDCSTGCAPEDGQSVCNQGCDGGWPWTAVSDIIGWGGLPTEAAYPYQGVDGTCSTSGKKLIEKPVSYSCLSGPNQSGGPADEKTQMPATLMSKGPLSIALDAGLFFDYTSGIINPSDPANDCEGTSLDHAVLIVGWGVDSTTKPATPYWIVKNSWAASWGENGYVRMFRGNGLCGLNNAVMSINY